MLNLPRLALQWLGRHAAPAYTISILLGLSLPQLAAAMKPFIPISIFTFITISFAQINLPGIRAVAAAPGKLAFVLVTSCAVPPLAAFLLVHLPFLHDLDPGIRLGIAMMAAAPPLMAAPVYTALLGLENSMALATLVLGMTTTPILGPLFTSLLAGTEVPLSPVVLAQRLALFIGTGILAGLLVRRLAGQKRISSVKNELDGIAVLLFFFFAIAAMDGVLATLIETPGLILGMLGISILFCTMNFTIGFFIFRRLGFNDQFSGAICVGLRNMGLLVAPIITILPKTTFLYFALAQIPIYVAPMVLKALKARLEPKHRTEDPK